MILSAPTKTSIAKFWLQIKSRLIVEYPLGQVPTKEMSPQARHDLLRSSVEVIRISHSVGTNKGIDDWLWYLYVGLFHTLDAEADPVMLAVDGFNGMLLQS